MNHDYAHCMDFKDECPQECFRAQLVRDISNMPYPRVVSWTKFFNTDECPVRECCNNCRFKKSITQYDYSGKGCKHTDVEGYACTAFTCEDFVIWKVGSDGYGTCEMFQPKENIGDE